jgi:GNAT superfamily N-acetyltransferase
MHVIEVKDKKTAREFLQLPRIIYANDPNWIPHLEADVKAVFDPAVNQQFQNGELCRWILKNDTGKLIGRVAAFLNKTLAYTYKQATGGMGFFECINDREAAFLLFDTCQQWLQERGMEAMDGPINFGEKDRYWGLMVDGIEKDPPYLVNYNPAYYREFFEAYGFQNYYEQYIFRIESSVVLPPIIEKKFERLTQTQGYHFEHLNYKKVDKYAEDFRTIYNKAWSDAHTNFKPMTHEKAILSFKRMKPVVEEELVVFAYHNGKPVAFFINILEINQILKHIKGGLNLWGKLKFLYLKWRGTCRVMYGLVFGVVPEYQNRGLESALIITFRDTVIPKNYYRSLIMTWIGDFNPKMIRLLDHIGARKQYTLITYRKMFRKDATFERHPVLS